MRSLRSTTASLSLSLVLATTACTRSEAPPAPTPSLVTRTPPASPPTSAPPREPGASAAPVYAVVMVEPNDVLNVRAAASADAAILAALPPTTRAVRGTGDETMVGTARWVAVHTPRGIGWANAAFLMAATSSAAFAADARPRALLEALRTTLEARGDLTPLVSARGLTVHDFGTERRFAPEVLATLAASTAKTKWNGPACGEACREGSFMEVVGTPLAQVLAKKDVEWAADRLLKGGNASAQPPAKLANVHYLSVMDRGTAASDHLDWRSFQLYFETTAQGEPKLLAIVPDVWSP